MFLISSDMVSSKWLTELRRIGFHADTHLFQNGVSMSLQRSSGQDSPPKEAARGFQKPQEQAAQPPCNISWDGFYGKGGICDGILRVQKGQLPIVSNFDP